ncbi:hypothetical protein ACVWZM_002949 [Bradyrhizobium sp. USDA 4501]
MRLDPRWLMDEVCMRADKFIPDAEVRDYFIREAAKRLEALMS